MEELKKIREYSNQNIFDCLQHYITIICEDTDQNYSCERIVKMSERITDLLAENKPLNRVPFIVFESLLKNFALNYDQKTQRISINAMFIIQYLKNGFREYENKSQNEFIEKMNKRDEDIKSGKIKIIAMPEGMYERIEKICFESAKKLKRGLDDSKNNRLMPIAERIKEFLK